MSNNSDNTFFTNKFSHIYIEKEAFSYPLTEQILARFPKAKQIEVEQYSEVFHRTRQHFQMQKRAMKLILAVKQPPFLYPGADVCHDFGHSHFYYTSSALNCLYNCEYCFLQGMFPSAHTVFFVNIEDYFSAVSELLHQHPVYLCISYETDLLAFEGIAPFCRRWIDFARHHPDLLIELRTKSANISRLSKVEPAANVVLAWTLSPQAVIERHEPGTPSLTARLDAIEKAIRAGWPVRLCFDPLLHIDGWEEAYRECVEMTFSRLPGEAIREVSVGSFRVPKDYMKRMRERRTDSPLLHYPFLCQDGVYRYPDGVNRRLTEHILRLIQKHIPEERIYTE